MTKPPIPRDPAQAVRKSGALSLFLPNEPDVEPVAEPGPAEGAATVRRPPLASNAPYARFRMCRGFIDDLNHILPIRLRIQLEGEIANGRTGGQVKGPSLRFRWEFVKH